MKPVCWITMSIIWMLHLLENQDFVCTVQENVFFKDFIRHIFETISLCQTCTSSSPAFSLLTVLIFFFPSVLCFSITMCWWVIGLLPVVWLCGRYYYSRRVIHGYLEHAMSTDMGNIVEFYSKSSGMLCRISRK